MSSTASTNEIRLIIYETHSKSMEVNMNQRLEVNVVNLLCCWNMELLSRVELRDRIKKMNDKIRQN